MKPLHLIFLLGAALALLIASCEESPPDWNSFDPVTLDDGWMTAPAETQGLDEMMLATAYNAAASLPYTYSLLVVRHGYLIAEQYFNGNQIETPNNVKSVSKSILGALAGIALHKGYLDSLNQKVLSFFPEYVTPSLDQRKHEITVRHLLMMRAGFARDEDVYSTVYDSPNWVQTTIELPLLYNPGERMVYNTFETHLLSAILTKATGMTTLDFANAHLCTPLGIAIGSWDTDAQGYYFGGNNMRLVPRDLAKFGLLYLNDGILDGEQIIPKEWIDESFTNFTGWGNSRWGDLVNTNYGYLWWMGEMTGHPVWCAIGHGGQYVVLIPELDMVVVSTANPQFDWDAADEHERAINHIIGTAVLGAVRN